MKYYTLEAIVDGKDVKFSRSFKTRTSAINFMFDYLDKNNKNSLSVVDEFAICGDKHNVEYVLNQHNRFRINRKSINA